MDANGRACEREPIIIAPDQAWRNHCVTMKLKLNKPISEGMRLSLAINQMEIACGHLFAELEKAKATLAPEDSFQWIRVLLAESCAKLAMLYTEGGIKP